MTKKNIVERYLNSKLIADQANPLTYGRHAMKGLGQLMWAERSPIENYVARHRLCSILWHRKNHIEPNKGLDVERKFYRTNECSCVYPENAYENFIARLYGQIENGKVEEFDV